MIKDYQQQIDDLFAKTGGYWSVMSNYVRLVEEVGEVGRIVNVTHGDKPLKDGEKIEDIATELADVLFLVMVLANQEGVDLDDACKKVIQKAQDRLEGE